MPSRSGLVHSVSWLTLVALTACRNAHEPEAAALAVGPVSSAASEAFPLHTRDAAGHTLEVPRAPERIVALLPSFTETLFALGAGTRVVGVDDFSDFPAESSRLPKVGGPYDANIEQILALAPDLVLCAKGSGAAAGLERAGVAFWQGDARSFEQVFLEIEAVGRLVGSAAEARQLTAQMRSDIAALEASTGALRRLRVYYEIDPTPYGAGPGSFIGTLLDKAGGSNILPVSLGDFPKLSPEFIVAQNPDVILGVEPRELAQRPGFAALSAVKEGRVYAWSAAEEHLLSRPGPRLPQALRQLALKLHPELR